MNEEMIEPSENEKLRSALAAAVETIQGYLSYTHDGDPWTEDARTMGEMDINGYGNDGRLQYALDLLKPAMARPLDEWHEDHGHVTWWKFPVNEPSYIGHPLCCDWPGYHTHWTPHPEIPAQGLTDETP